MKALVSLFLIGIPLSGLAQIPNVLVKLDFVIESRGDSNRTIVKAYDRSGKHSVVGLSFTIEPGFDLYISQRFQRIENDPDKDRLDEYYMEDRDYWRVGKQYLPFGRNRILNESVYAGRVNMTVGGMAIPLQLCAAQSRSGGQRGLVGRLGSKVGVSVASGSHFGQNGTSLTQIRTPEASTGKGSGYKFVAGVDAQASIGKWQLAAEHVAFRNPHRPEDTDLDVTDLEFSIRPSDFFSGSIGIAREWNSSRNFVRLGTEHKVANGVWISSFARFADDFGPELGFGVRLRP